MRIGLVLDTTALLAHLRLERPSCGELLACVVENGDVTGVPVMAILDVMCDLDAGDIKRLNRMLAEAENDGPIVVLPLLAQDVLDVHYVGAQIAGGLGVAHAVVEAIKYDVSMATTRADNVTGVLSPGYLEPLS